ncbi:MAG: division/cell wall cluster transcriptional repressor MraZ [Planctomycetota bacterium]|nr:division/cell wall cluster transcriptional repressor MraZ [Planctomycetota bacterium]MDG2083517.1 division/cell wall cluster transcriptional repressor MraZ [Planctomycetota bacterium]
MAAHFKGQFELTLDDKGRVIIPSRLRAKIDPRCDGEGFVATAGTAPCLWIYTTAEWDRISEETRKYARGSAELHELQRYLFGMAEDLNPDRQGRVLIGNRLRNWAQLDKEVVFVGCFDRIEIWDAAVWNERNEDREAYQNRLDAFRDEHGDYARRMDQYFGGTTTDV